MNLEIRVGYGADIFVQGEEPWEPKNGGRGDSEEWLLQVYGSQPQRPPEPKDWRHLTSEETAAFDVYYRRFETAAKVLPVTICYVGVDDYVRPVLVAKLGYSTQYEAMATFSPAEIVMQTKSNEKTLIDFCKRAKLVPAETGWMALARAVS